MKRVFLSSAFARLGLATTVLRLRNRVRDTWLTVLTYHRAGPPPSIELIDDHVVAATAEGFAHQIAFCKRFFSVVGIDDVLGFVRGARLPQSPLLITFDDGYLDNFEVAYPILQRHGLTGVFFIATSYIEGRRLFWWDRIHFILKSSRREVVELDYPYPLRLTLGEMPHGRDAAIEVALRIVKDCYALDLPRFLAALGAAAGVHMDGPTESALVREHLMTWDHIRALHRGGMDVQSHTHTHRVLHTLPDAELLDDLTRSRRALEDVLDARVRAVAYPVGKAIAYSARIRDVVRAAGYELGFSNRTGINRFAGFDELDAKRITVDPTFTDDYFASVMAVPRLAYPT